MFQRIGKGWENLDNVMRIIPNADGESLAVVTRDNSKFRLDGADAKAFLKATGIKPDEFWVAPPEPEAVEPEEDDAEEDEAE